MKNTLTFEQLDVDSVLDEGDLLTIARLIYDTDPYIYPAMCSAAEAEKIIPYLLSAGTDSMFCKQNLFVARLNNNVVGVILWHNGPLAWKRKAFIETCNAQSIRIAPTFEQVAQEYLSTYDQPTADISIINVCVDASVRGSGVGTEMLKAFIARHKSESMELVTLTGNTIAIDLYKRRGFEILREEDGFSVEYPKPRCYIMSRKEYK